jgi:hypothetical protein
MHLRKINIRELPIQQQNEIQNQCRLSRSPSTFQSGFLFVARKNMLLFTLNNGKNKLLVFTVNLSQKICVY